jgi:hypothetical protein
LSARSRAVPSPILVTSTLFGKPSCNGWNPNEFFSFSWHPYAIDPTADYSKEKPTLVEFRLEATANGTVLLLTESGFDNIPAGRRLEAYRMNDRGWTLQMKNIDSHVAPGT